MKVYWLKSLLALVKFTMYGGMVDLAEALKLR